jgi:hypothetical protein
MILLTHVGFSVAQHFIIHIATMSEHEETISLPEDLDTSRFSSEHLEVLHKEFPDVTKEELARYLIGKNNHLKHAKQQLQKALEIRQKIGPVVKSSIANEMSTGKIYCRGVDKDGRPVLVWIASNNFVSKRNMEETKRLLIWWAEYTIREKIPDHHSKVTVLVHMNGTSNDNVDTELYKQCVPMFQVRRLFLAFFLVSSSSSSFDVSSVLSVYLSLIGPVS